MTALPKVTEEEQVQLDYEKMVKHIIFFSADSGPSNAELREDGTFELREDGTFELRE